MKNYNLLFCIISVTTLDIYSSYFSSNPKSSKSFELLDYQEMNDKKPSSSPLSLNLYNDDDYSPSSRVSTYHTAYPLSIQNQVSLAQPIIQHARLLVAEDTNTLVVPQNSPDSQALIPSDTSIIAVPVPYDYRGRRGEQKLSVKTRIIFAFVVSLSMIELGFDIIDVSDYYSSPKSIHAGPTFPIAKLTNAILRNSMLYALYKFNQDRLG